VVKNKFAVRWDMQAAADLKAICQHIKKESPDGAERVKKELLRLAKSLATFPEKYPVEPLLKDGKGNYRSVAKWHYKMIYELTEHEVIILMIFHTRQNPSNLIL